MRHPLRALVSILVGTGLVLAGLTPVSPAAGAGKVAGQTSIQLFGPVESLAWEYLWSCDNQAPFECERHPGRLVFQVFVDNPPPSTVTVDWEVEDITAVHGVNYGGDTSGTVTIPEGRARGFVVFPIIDTGSVDAPDKTLRLRLTGSNVPGAEIGDPVIGAIKSAGHVHRDCTLSRTDGQSISATCTDRPADDDWRVGVVCAFPFVGIHGEVVIGNGTSTASCDDWNTSVNFVNWEFHRLD